MSAEATGWVYRHSPYVGAGMAVHLAVADSVNGDYGNEFWMSISRLSRKARVSRSTATAAMAVLVTDGYLQRLDNPAMTATSGRPGRYRFLFPDVPVAYETRTQGVTGQRSGGDRTSRTGVTGDRAQSQERSQVEPKIPELELGIEDDPPAPEPEQTPRARKRGPRDDLYDALVAAFGPASTPSRQRFYGRTVSQLVAAEATPVQVAAARATMRRRGWDDPSPEAMVKHWDSLIAESGASNPAATRWWENE